MFPEKNNIKAHISVHATMQVNGNHRFAYFYVTVSMSSVAAIWISRTSTGFPHLSDENQRKPRSLCTGTCTEQVAAFVGFRSASFCFVSFRLYSFFFFRQNLSSVNQPLRCTQTRGILTTYSLTTYSKPMKAHHFQNGELSLVWNKL